MAATITDFLQATREFADRVGEGDEDQNSAAFLAYVAVGAIWKSTHHIDNSFEALKEMVDNREIANTTERELETYLRALVSQQRMAEDLLVFGLVYHIDRRLEGFAEDGARVRKQTEQDLEHFREEMKDPVKAAAFTNRQNQMMKDMIPGYEPTAPENMADEMAEVLSYYSQPVDLEQMRKAKQHVTTWRAVAFPILEQ